VDAQGNLYVANNFVGSMRSPHISVYAPNGSSPARTIAAGVTAPWAMTLDSKGNLYLLNECAASGGCTNGQNNVAVYTAGTSTPVQVVSDGMNFPIAIAVDQSSNLYVANIGNGTGPGEVTVYGGKDYSLLHTLSQGVKGPRYLAVTP
jgi:hypothetical protein